MKNNKDMPLINHLEELRWRVLKSLASIVVMSILTFNFANYLVDWLIAPAGKISQEMSLQVLTIQGESCYYWRNNFVHSSHNCSNLEICFSRTI
jgi:sec-independent protein translocase protein TatC